MILKNETAVAGVAPGPDTGEVLPPPRALTPVEFAATARTLSPEDLAQEIRFCHDQVVKNLERGLGWAFQVGQRLLWVKERVCRHGEFEDWVREHCPFSVRTAQKYMKLVRDWERLPKAPHEALLDYNALLGYRQDDAGDGAGKRSGDGPAGCGEAPRANGRRKGKTSARRRDGPGGTSKPSARQTSGNRAQLLDLSEGQAQIRVAHLGLDRFELRFGQGQRGCKLILSRKQVNELYYRQLDPAMDLDDEEGKRSAGPAQGR
jgi:hypothetical protein